MAYEHYIEKVKEMDPRPGNAFFTVYYNATEGENKNLFEYVEAFVNGMKQDLQSDPEAAADIYGKELGGKHNTLAGKPYTVCDVLMDLYVQLNKGRNATKSMIDRWNNAQSGLGLDDNTIDIEFGVRPPAGKIPNSLFEEQ